MKHPAERQVDELDAQVEIEIDLLDAAELLERGDYRPARGMYRGTHWRCERGVGCYHLRIHGDRAWLHWDGWDPRRFPGRHVVETPQLGAPMVAGVIGALALAVRRFA